MNYYNENDKYAAAWLRNLIAAGHIAPGDVDERSILDVRPIELAGYTQCHFFAGIGGWPYALDLAGWPRDRPVWTGSCPCQPFSTAGKGAGFDDERHLWPAFYHLIGERRPPVVFGEQVASKGGLAWLDLVQTDMEVAGYAFGPFDLCAAGVGAPHIRQRLYFVADTRGPESGRVSGGRWETIPADGVGGAVGELADTDGRDAIAEGLQRSGEHGQQPQDGSADVALGDADCGRREQTGCDTAGDVEADGGSQASRDSGPSATNGFWRDADWLPCIDGKARPVKPGTFPLAHGATRRVGRLRAYGNAIVAPLAVEFVATYLEATGVAQMPAT